MSEEKKKGGFWSWLGLGKNKSEPQPTNEQKKEEQPKEQLHDNEVVIEEKQAHTTSHDVLEADKPTTEMPMVESAVDFSQEIEQENQDLFTITADNPATETETGET